jgi:hypothetical protein
MNYKKAAEFFQKEAKDELKHAQKIQEYMTGFNILPEIEQVYQENPLLSQITTYVISGKEAKIPYIARRGEVFALKANRIGYLSG